MKTTKLAIFLLIIGFYTAYSREINLPNGHKVSSNEHKVMDLCTGASGSKELWVNNVRTIIFTAGDMWWDLFGNGNAYYIVPATKDRSKGASSLFAGSIWVGGFDAGGQLRVAAMTYRQNGYDYWPGPLDITNASVTNDVCLQYDRHFPISRFEVESYVLVPGPVPYNAQVWPGNGDISKNQDQYLAPFEDVNGDGIYNPNDGDYPAFDIYNTAAKDNLGVCKARVFGDYCLWWVFNDKGNVHTETQGLAIGLEIRAQAFAFQTSDEINNMTFYSYQVINRSTYTLNKTYFTVWTDADLGYYSDDYVGCDVGRGLGYIYNGASSDPSVSGTPGYGDYPPACGCDFFRGPLADLNDNIDNNFDGNVDEPGETIGMTNFTYYNNNIGSFPPQTTNPAIATHYYGYMTGKWKDGSPFTYGGNAYGGSTPLYQTNPQGRILVYTGDPYAGTGWTEASANNTPGDRRFLQSAGPFTLKAGAVNYVTFGMPWAQTPIKNQQLYSVELLKTADDKAQALFDNCFKILNGPDAPDITIQELDQTLIVYLTNAPTSNNHNEKYREADVTILPVPGTTIAALQNPDQYYRFQGYKVYQLVDNTVSQTDLSDASKARLVFQCDIQDSIARLVNYEYDASVGAYVPIVKVDGADAGLKSTFKITADAFSSGTNNSIVNHKTYYFMAVAYAYNNYLTYKPDTDPTSSADANYLGQKRPYLEGRKSKKASGIPHIPAPEKEGTVMQSYYGYGPKITRIEGQGNGGNILDLTDESVAQILANNFIPNPTYLNGRGPVNIKVVDPLNVPNSTFTLKLVKFDGLDASLVTHTKKLQITDAKNMGAFLGNIATWTLKDNTTGNTYALDTTMKAGKEYYMPDIGMSITMQQQTDIGMALAGTTYSLTSAVLKEGDFLESTLTFSDPKKAWLSGIKDMQNAVNPHPFNWLRDGVAPTSNGTSPVTSVCDGGVIVGFAGGVNYTDPKSTFDNVINGTWGPYCLTASSCKSGNFWSTQAGPGYNGKIKYVGDSYNDPSKVHPVYLAGVDVVITSDKSKWSRCIVIEMQDDPNLAQGNAKKFQPRAHASVDKNGNTGDGIVTNDPNDADYISATGMGWFPGYAINVETGERLNIVFGEDSWNHDDNGDDMLWNPTANQLGDAYAYPLGGRHYIYIFGNNKTDYYNTTSLTFTPVVALNNTKVGAGRYDGCAQMITQWNTAFAPATGPAQAFAGRTLRSVLSDAMWVSLPVLSSAKYSFKNPASIPCDAKVRIRVNKPYRFGYSGYWTQKKTTGSYIGDDVILLAINTTTTNQSTSDTLTGSQNNNFPMYQFSTSDIYTVKNVGDVAKNALDFIRVVPNPYYGYSTYEGNRIDTKVRITNLPNVCTITIYSLNGTLIRTITRSVDGQEDQYTYTNDFKQSKRLSYIEWDLKNQTGVLVASGMYIIHVDAPGIGEKIIKWFGIMRPYDLQSY